MSDRGPPPAKKDKVDAIPVVDATQEVVDECKLAIIKAYCVLVLLSTHVHAASVLLLVHVRLTC